MNCVFDHTLMLNNRLALTATIVLNDGNLVHVALERTAAIAIDNYTVAGAGILDRRRAIACSPSTVAPTATEEVACRGWIDAHRHH